MLPSGPSWSETALDDAGGRGLPREAQCVWSRTRHKADRLRNGDRIRLRVPQDKDAWTGAHLDLIKREVGCVDASVVARP